MKATPNLKNLLTISIILLGFSCTVAAGKVIYVDADAAPSGGGQSWNTAYMYLQDALYEPPASGDQIWVAKGMYKPDEDEGGNVTADDRTATFQLINGVALYGGFTGDETSVDERDWETNETILSGDLDGNDVGFANNGENSYNVVTGSGTDATAVLDGFTVTAGNANEGLYPNTTCAGGGVLNYSGRPTLTNCRLSGNSGKSGGGIANWDYSSPTITNCTISGNIAENPVANSHAHGGGIYCKYDSSPTITNCSITNNTVRGDYADGGGIACKYDSSPLITNCMITENTVDQTSSSNASQGGGIYCYDNSNPTIINCAIGGNATDGYFGGGAYFYYSDPNIINCTITDNDSNYSGGGVYCKNSNLTITDCTFSNNSADWFGGGFCCYDSNAAIINCILWGDWASSGQEIAIGSSTLTVSYSDVMGGEEGVSSDAGTLIWGEGNIEFDPLFVDPDNDDYHLRAVSPCIDAADNTAVPADTADLDNDGDTSERTPLDLDGKSRFFDHPLKPDTGNSAPGYPDIVDMGAHEFDPYPVGDLNQDCHVDFRDIAIVADHWLECTAPGCD